MDFKEVIGGNVGSFSRNYKLLFISLIVMKVHITKGADYFTGYFLFYIALVFLIYLIFFHFLSVYFSQNKQDNTDIISFNFSTKCLSDALVLYERFESIVCQNTTSSKGI